MYLLRLVLELVLYFVNNIFCVLFIFFVFLFYVLSVFCCSVFLKEKDSVYGFIISSLFIAFRFSVVFFLFYSFDKNIIFGIVGGIVRRRVVIVYFVIIFVFI